MGHKVIGVDVNRAKVETMDSGRTPIIEARMAELVAEAKRAGLLHATTDATAAVLIEPLLPEGLVIVSVQGPSGTDEPTLRLTRSKPSER